MSPKALFCMRVCRSRSHSVSWPDPVDKRFAEVLVPGRRQVSFLAPPQVLTDLDSAELSFRGKEN